MNTELMTDDEALREQGMSEGVKNVPELRLKLRPMTALSFSWMLRNKVFEEDGADIMSKAAAYAYLHTSDKEEIRSVVNHRGKFLDAVDEWIDRNVQHHNQLEPLSGEMNTAFEQYMAAQSSGGSPYKSDGSKN
jgi:hypothetical protein